MPVPSRDMGNRHRRRIRTGLTLWLLRGMFSSSSPQSLKTQRKPAGTDRKITFAAGGVSRPVPVDSRYRPHPQTRYAAGFTLFFRSNRGGSTPYRSFMPYRCSLATIALLQIFLAHAQLGRGQLLNCGNAYSAVRAVSDWKTTGMRPSPYR